jgi:plastocyanin
MSKTLCFQALVLMLVLAASCCFVHGAVYVVGLEQQRGSNLYAPPALVIDAGDTVTWFWNPNSTRYHNVAPEDPLGPRCTPTSPSTFASFGRSLFVRGNDTLSFASGGFPAYSWSWTFNAPGNYPFYCTEVLSPTINHCMLAGQRGIVVVKTPQISAVYQSNLPTATPSRLNR